MGKPDLQSEERENCGVTAALIVLTAAALAAPNTTPLVDTANVHQIADLQRITAGQVRAAGCEPSENGLNSNDAMHLEDLVYTGTVLSWLLNGSEPARCSVPWTAVGVNALDTARR